MTRSNYLHRFRIAVVVPVFVLLVSCAALPAPASASDLEAGPPAKDAEIAKRVANDLRKLHLLRHPLDDEISRRCLMNLIDALDPLKLYFTQGDFDEFSAYNNRLDDMVVAGDLTFPYLVWRRFDERVKERMALIEELLAEKHDFTIDEAKIVDPDCMTRARTPEETREVWRRQIKYDLLVARLAAEEQAEKRAKKAASEPAPGTTKTADADDPVTQVRKRYANFDKYFVRQLDHNEMLELFLTALVGSYDPHSSFMSPKTLDNFDIEMKLELEGIGAELGYEDGYTIVRRIIPGGAADKDGKLKAGDKIVGVGQGESGDVQEVVDIKLTNVVQQIRGARGTMVRLKVVSEDDPVPKIYALMRERVELKEKEAQAKVIPLGTKADGTPYSIGIIELPSFYRDMDGADSHKADFKSTTKDVRKILEKFTQEKVDAVLIDLRMNGGGALLEAIELTGLFIDTGPVVQVKDRKITVYPDEEEGSAWTGPLVVLTSKLSASASEIFAGAIQDYHRGLVVGDPTTHGKGTVQRLIDIDRRQNLGALKVTTQQFYRPNGASTQALGVPADIVLPSLLSQRDVGEADLEFHLPFDQIQEAEHRDYAFVTPQLVEQLRGLASTRIEASPEFSKVKHQIEYYNTRIKNRKEVPLNEEKYRAEVAETRSDELDFADEEEDDDGAKDPIDEKHYYLREALAITGDYVRLGPWNPGDGSM